MVLFPNAKINVGLSVVRKRQDGFHDIETVFVPIGLHDILEFVPGKGGTTEITITGIELDSNPGENLVVKAWDLMHDAYGVEPVSINLHKVIPAGAGLGGGSADAAFMLKGLNDFFNCGCSQSELETMASEIGSDCAFFINNQIAFGTGRGEILEPLQVDFSAYEILLVNPGIHVGTREAYSGVVPGEPEISIRNLICNPAAEWQQSIENDFEKSVFKLHPAIADLKLQIMELGAVYAAMSGSGSSVFGLFQKGTLQQQSIDFGNWFTYRGELG